MCHLSELERLRQQLVTDIRTNQALEKDLNDMDIKIGLLVRNRITLQVNVTQRGMWWGARYTIYR